MQGYLRVLIPIGINEPLCPLVLSGLSAIPEEYKIRVFVHSVEPTPSDRIHGIVAARNSLRRVCSVDSFNLLMDSDVVMEDWVLPLLIRDLEENSDVGASAISTRDVVKDYEPAHVNLSCMLIRGELLSQTPFRYTGSGCECLTFNEDIRALGYRVRYVSDRCLREVPRL